MQPFFDTNILIDWLFDRAQAIEELSRYSSHRISRIARTAADIRHATRMKLLDALILATAQVHGAVLVTRNTKDFSADMPGIRVPYIL